MPLAQADTRFLLRASDHYLVMLGIFLLGYALLGKVFASLGVPPVYMGEVALFTGLIVSCSTGCLLATLATPTAVLLAILLAWVQFRTLPYISEYGFNALRDSVIVFYSGFAFIVASLLLEDSRRIATAVKYYSRFVSIFIPLSPILFGFASFSAFYFIKAGEITVHLAGITVFILAGFRKISPWALVTLLVTLMMTTTISRGAMLAYLIPVVLGFLVLGKVRQLVIILVGGATILGAAYIAEVSVTDYNEARRSTERSLSVRQIVENATSIFGSAGDQTEGTKAWRLEWWDTIINDTIYGPHFWTGRGFGLNLADADGFWDGAHPDAPPTRSPHSAHMTVLARAGVPGLVLWLAVIVSWMALMAKAMFEARKREQIQIANLFLVVICYILAILINASFDVALEGPMQGILFWCLFGFGLGCAMVYRAPRELKLRCTDLPVAHVH
jgi:hypothetical protein